VGSDVPQINEPNGHSLKEESLTAYEIGYTGHFANKTTIGLAYYINDDGRTTSTSSPTSAASAYTAANPPRGWPLPPGRAGAAVQTRGICLPAEFTYSNLGKLRNKGFEVSIDHSVHRFAERVRELLVAGRPEQGLATRRVRDRLPPHHRFNAGVSVNQRTVPWQPDRQLHVEGVLDGRPRRLLQRRHRTPSRW
jgi:hypothetical protein